jgi:hypothetical protein
VRTEHLTYTHKIEEFFSLSPTLLKTFQKNVYTQTLSCGNTYHFAATFVDLLQAARKLLVRHEIFGSSPPHLGRKLSRTLHCGDSVELAATTAGSPAKGLDGGGRVYRRSHISRYFPSQPGLGLVLRSIARSKTPVQLKHPVKTDGFLISLSRETAIVRHYTFAKIFLILN